MSDSATYAKAGVDTAEKLSSGLGSLLSALNETFQFPTENPPLLQNGFFANVVKLTDSVGVALATDGVGTKLLIAEALERYETIGIDLIAMNANDILCVGATPISLVDYIALQQIDDAFLASLGEGLREGAKRAAISIPAGEIAQVPEMLSGLRPGSGFDLVGTCIGVVDIDRIIIGDDVAPGDKIIGIPSSGIHSNGYTLARGALLPDSSELDVQVNALSETHDGIDRPLGDELLEPTRIYVREAVSLFRAGVRVTSLAHITGDGLLNLARTRRQGVGFKITEPLKPQPIFRLIQQMGEVTTAEMHTVFNMGTGFCLTVPESDEAEALRVLAESGASDARSIGEVVADERGRVWIDDHGLVGEEHAFRAG